MGLLNIGRGSAPIGLEIGSNSFRLAQLKPSADKPILINYASVKIPKELVKDGEISDIEAVAKILADIWHDREISEKRVIVGISNQKVVARVVEMPFMAEAELRGAIQYQLNEYVPIPAEDAIVDFQIIPTTRNGHQSKVMDVLIVAARKDMVENTVAAIEKANLKPIIVDISSLAFARAVIASEDSYFLKEVSYAGGAIALINVGSSITDIIVVEDGTPRFARMSSTGGNTFTKAIADQLDIPFDEAQDLKERIGLPPYDDRDRYSNFELDVKDRESAVYTILDQEMMRFTAEIRRSIGYYLTQSADAGRIEKILVSGGGVRLRNFMRYLRENLQIKAELANPLGSIRIGRNLRALKGMMEEEEISMATCLGLAIRGIEK